MTLPCFGQKSPWRASPLPMPMLTIRQSQSPPVAGRQFPRRDWLSGYPYHRRSSHQPTQRDNEHVHR